MHRRSSESRQANTIQVVARDAVRSGVQDERRAACHVHSAERWHQQVWRSDLADVSVETVEIDIQLVENLAKDGHADPPNTKQIILE
jgi:hypothetical protein